MVTHSQLFLHIILAVNGKDCFTKSSFRVELEGYILGIASSMDCEFYAVHCHYDHSHMFLRLNPDITIADLIDDIKSASEKFVAEEGWVKDGKFSWQNGYGAFSYGLSEVDDVVKYIKNQDNYHKKVSFRDEFMELLRIFDVEYDEKDLFEWV